MYLVLTVMSVCVVALLLDRWKPSTVFGLAALVLLISGKVEVSAFLQGFSNPSIISIFLLIILTSALNDNFNLVGILDRLFSGARSEKSFLLRMGFSAAGISSFMNNTPIVAMMIPYVYQWGKKNKVAPSRLLIPLSYATILGGMITVLGTSTNLVLVGFIQSAGASTPGIMDFLIPGILVTIIGLLFIGFIGHKILPEQTDILEKISREVKEYLMEAQINPNSPVIGKTVMQAGLRNLDGIFLVEILRGAEIISPVSSDTHIMAGDRLFFAGESGKVVDLVHQNNGLTLPIESSAQQGTEMKVVECVIPANSELLGRNLKQVEFREKYDAAVLAIHRNGERLRGKIGEILLDKGDILLISAGNTFFSHNRSGKDLYSISEVKSVKQVSPRKGRMFLLLSGLTIGLAMTGLLELFGALLILLTLALFFGFTNFELIKKNVSLDLLVILGAALTLSNALIHSGAADRLGELLSALIGGAGPITALVSIYVITVVLTQFITNAAAVAIVFPIGFAMAHEFTGDQMGLYMAMAFGASCCFLTPVGYQTNLMVYGPGNYRFSDFIKIGLPLTLIYSAVVLTWLIYRYI